MKAALYERTGPASEVLVVRDIPMPKAGPGEVLVQIRASGINPSDVKRRAGWNGQAMAHPLIVPHSDGAGDIVAVGSGVDAARIGERVWLWNAQGSYGAPGRAHGTASEFITIASDHAVQLPGPLSYDDGACLGVPAMTAFRAVSAAGPVAGTSVLVNGGAGSVGLFAVQMAAFGGAQVIASVGSDSDADMVRAAGAHQVVNRKTASVADAVREFTGGAGADLIVEVDFAANIELDAEVLKPDGMVSTYSSTSNVHPIFPYYAYALKGARFTLVQSFHLPPDIRRSGEETISAMAGAGALACHIGAHYPLTEIASAHERVERGERGKTLVIPG
ncbi:NADPH:quinone reductase [Frigidibacter mobilis]|uniref:Putative NADPH:quinone oxidoreductase protein n=1 Tax=Frigidibacter mobilis TaxID=1335048 RepID=A0A159Z3S9_9RHOB|nr:NADPH:quinone reductase [Frigidibacter mobilis]AMY68864.1 putative NADPH:quinone oxidoreductase protein [Frigidibacter mobilis]